MAHDIFEHNLQDEEDIDIENLEETLRRQRQTLLAQQWRNGELYVCIDAVTVYENPSDPSPIVTTFDIDSVILIASLKDSKDYGGFRDVLLPVRGWIWTSVDEYDRAFIDASKMLQNPTTREASTSIMKFKKFGKKHMHRFRQQKYHSKDDQDINKTVFDNKNITTRDYAFSDAALNNPHIKNKHIHQHTNHLHINISKTPDPPNNNNDITPMSTVAKESSSNVIRGVSMNLLTTKSQQMSYDEPSIEHSSKYRRHSHQVTFGVAQIEKITEPMSLEKLDKLNEIRILKDDINIVEDSHGHIEIIKDKEKLGSTSPKSASPNDGDDGLTDTKQISLGDKILNSNIIRKTVHFIRSYPSLLTLIYIGFTGFVEGIIFFDIITDILVTVSLFRANYMSTFIISACLIITPYFIAWSSLWGLIEKKREQPIAQTKFYKIMVPIFTFCPAGVLLLIAFDIWTVFEFIFIRPLYFFCIRRGKLFRNDTFEELGYRKLRRVSEVCSETIFQAFVQLYIVIALRYSDNLNSDGPPVSEFDVSLSLICSIFVIILWFGIILRIEASVNGISLIEYIPIVLQGSFKFVPFLPAIERGSKNGLQVNWCLFKFDLNALSVLGVALGSSSCNLQLIKVSVKTFKKLPRRACKYFGKLMKSALNHPIRVLVSRLDKDLEELFGLFDEKDDKNFLFIDFVKACLSLAAQDNEVLLYPEISSTFYELASKKEYDIDGNGNTQKVWLLDLLLKFRTSKKYISLIDIEQPIDYAVKRHNINLLTFCRSIGWISPNHQENIIQSVTQNKLDITHCLTEDDGIPIVVEITEGMELLAAYIEFHDKDNKFLIPSSDNISHRSNLDVVQKYHELNNYLKNNSKGISDDDNKMNKMDLMGQLFKDVSIYISASMCELEQTTSTTDETIQQFWNERLLFIVPFSVIDEIIDDPTLSLQRDTTHHSHIPHLMHTTTFNDPDFIHHEHALPIIATSIKHQNSLSQSIKEFNKQQSKHVRFAHEIDDDNLIHTKIEEIEKEHDNNENDDDNDLNHQSTGTVHIKNVPSLPLASIPSDSSALGSGNMDNDQMIFTGNDYNKDNSIKDKDGNKLSHHTGLSHILAGVTHKITTKDKNSVPDESPKASPQPTPQELFVKELAIDLDINNVSSFPGIVQERAKTDQVSIRSPSMQLKNRILRGGTGHLKKASSIDPNLLFSPALTHKKRESALRDALQFNAHSTKLQRISSFGGPSGITLPHFARKLYLDFKLFDDSGTGTDDMTSSTTFPGGGGGINQSDDNLFGFPSTTSGSNNFNKKMIQRYRTKSHHRKAHSKPKIIKKNQKWNKLKLNRAISYNSDMDNDSGDSDGFDFEEKGFGGGNVSPRSTTSRSNVLLNDNAGIESGEGTFLGSCHLSVNLDEIDKLKTFHHKVHEKDIKIGRKLHDKQHTGKLKFKVYCNALAAYLKYGKGYGDKLIEENDLEDIIVHSPSPSSKKSNSNEMNKKDK